MKLCGRKNNMESCDKFQIEERDDDIVMCEYCLVRNSEYYCELTAHSDEKITIGTWLQVFPGFYGSILEWLFDNAYDNDQEYIRDSNMPEDLKEAMLDHYYESKAYYASVQPMEDSISRQCMKLIEGKLKELKVVESIIFQELVSPKYYNFSNDSINVEVVFSDENIQEI